MVGPEMSWLPNSEHTSEPNGTVCAATAQLAVVFRQSDLLPYKPAVPSPAAQPCQTSYHDAGLSWFNTTLPIA